MLIRCGARPFGTRKSPLTSRLRPLWSSTALVLGRSDVPSGMLLCMFLLMLLCMLLCILLRMLLCMLLCLLLCTLLYMLLCMLPCMLSSLTHPIPQSSLALSCLGTRHSPAFSCSAPQLGCLHFCSFLLTSLPLFAPSFAFLFRLIRCNLWPLFCSALVLGCSGPRPLLFSATLVLGLFNLGRSSLSRRSATVALWRSMDISRGPLRFSLLAPSFFLLTPSLLSLTLSLLSPKLLLLLRGYISSSQLIHCMLFVACRC